VHPELDHGPFKHYLANCGVVGFRQFIVMNYNHAMENPDKEKKPNPDDVLRRMLKTPPESHKKGKKGKNEDRKKG